MPGRWPGSCLALAPVRDRPEGVSERELERALTQGWDIEPAALTYAPVGAGSYHWVVTGARGGRWFVTVDDLDHKSWLGSTRSAALAGLRFHGGKVGFVRLAALCRCARGFVEV